jgi:acyl-ACP thioesterase
MIKWPLRTFHHQCHRFQSVMTVNRICPQAPSTKPFTPRRYNATINAASLVAWAAAWTVRVNRMARYKGSVAARLLLASAGLPLPKLRMLATAPR